MPTPTNEPDRRVTALDRRRFLQIAGAGVAATALDQSIARAASIPAHRVKGSIDDVEHVVVLMQENRSFDHYFGTMRGVRGYGDPHPATLPNGKPVWFQSDGARDILPFHPTAEDLGEQYLGGTPHGWWDGQKALNAGKFDQWIPAKGTLTMAHLERQDASFHHALADAFTVCDAYHCGFLGNTDPNRYYMWSGWTGNDGKGGGPVMYNDELGYDWTTYPERLERAGVSWKVYQDEGNGLDAPGYWGWTDDAFIGNYGDNSLLYFNSYRNALPGSPLYEKARRGTHAKSGDDYLRILREDVRKGRLPQVSWIASPEAFSEHSNWPTSFGAWYTAQVLDALTSNPDVWARTVLFVTYDENDGFFDHLVPPHATNPVIPGASTVPTDHEFYPGIPGNSSYPPGPFGLGIRVPMLVASPWSTGGWVCSETFDHTSLIRFTEKRFGVTEPNITPYRRAVCGDLTSAFDFAKRPQRAPALPDVSGWAPRDRDRHDTYEPQPPATGALPAQEPGRRPARPIGYDLRTTERSTAKTVGLDLVNAGSLGAGLQARLLAPAGAPHSYTLGGRSRLRASWPVSGDYRIEVHGPNGFFRALAGDRATDAVHADLDLRAGEGRVRVHVEGRAEVTSAYPGTLRSSGGRRPRSYVVDTRRTGGWYDVTVTGPDGFERTWAGHLEDGRPGTSDPQLGR